VSDAEAFPILHELMVKDGLHLGLSSAINVAGAEKLARHLGPGKRIVTILCDNGSRYLSTIWNPDWLLSRGLPLPPWRES
jgi:cysteine synthase A